MYLLHVRAEGWFCYLLKYCSAEISHCSKNVVQLLTTVQFGYWPTGSFHLHSACVEMACLSWEMFWVSLEKTEALFAGHDFKRQEQYSKVAYMVFVDPEFSTKLAIGMPSSIPLAMRRAFKPQSSHNDSNDCPHEWGEKRHLGS